MCREHCQKQLMQTLIAFLNITTFFKINLDNEKLITKSVTRPANHPSLAGFSGLRPPPVVACFARQLIRFAIAVGPILGTLGIWLVLNE